MKKMCIRDKGKAVTEAKAGKIEYRLDKQNIIHVPIGKASFGAEKLLTNRDAITASKNDLSSNLTGIGDIAVSYTHLDVYKRQERYRRHHHGPRRPRCYQ